MASTKAQIKASNKYNKENYKKIQANIKPEDFYMIEKYCASYGLSKAQLIVKAVRYCVDHDIDLNGDNNNE